MSNLTSASGEASVSSGNKTNQYQSPNPAPAKKKRNLPGNPDPDAEVVALSPKTLMATNRFVCEICNKGFQRDQNLQLHRRGHNLPWKLRQRTSKEVKKKVYICPEPSCVHHDPSRALGDLTGIKKHFCRKHGEKKWKCEKCSKKYAVQSDWKAHSKTCGTREYRCDCGTLFSRRDSFITHRAFCDALAEESARVTAVSMNSLLPNQATTSSSMGHGPTAMPGLTGPSPPTLQSTQFPLDLQSSGLTLKREEDFRTRPMEVPLWLAAGPPSTLNQLEASSPLLSTRLSHDYPSSQLTQEPRGSCSAAAHMSATALLQKAAQMGATVSKPSSMLRAASHIPVGGLPPASSRFGLDLSSWLDAAGSSAATSAVSSTSAAAAAAEASSLQEMMSSLTGGPGFGSYEEALGGYLSSRREEQGGNEGLTRDFLGVGGPSAVSGLRGLSQRDMFTMAAASGMGGPSQCVNPPLGVSTAATNSNSSFKNDAASTAHFSSPRQYW
ncbi:indeterminate-domain 2 protein [Nymphaea thermarum]|nr:indeterminate-domain 2 protein [Nymphaea thermarum]